MKKLLFICTSNIKRSVTAERLFCNCSGIETKSAGTYKLATIRVNQELVDWADMIFVMAEEQEGHLSYMKDNFNMGEKPIYDLAISDVYATDDKDLKVELIKKVSKYIDLKACLDDLLTSLK